jgi:hypothetical protein
MLQHKEYVRPAMKKQEFSMSKYIHNLTTKGNFYPWKSEDTMFLQAPPTYC